MTNPFGQAQVPTAQRPWQPMGGGYEQATAEAANRFGQPPVPVALQQQMMQAQPQQQLPPQMQQSALQQLNGDPSPLSYMQPNMPQQMQMRQAPMQQMPQQMQPVQQQQMQPGQYGQQPQQQQFAPNPQYQQQAPQQQPIVLQGPGVPTELQGRSLPDLIQMYQGLRQTHLQNMAQQQQAPVPQQQQPAQQPQSQQPAQAAFDWRNPAQSVGQVVDDRLNNMVEQKLMPLLAPIAAQNAMTGVQNARQQAASAIGSQRFAAMEPAILAALQGADPIHLQNPRTWVLAAQAVAGQMALSGVQSPIIHNQNAPGTYPSQQVQPGQNPLPNMNSFFSEQPNQGGPMGGGFQLSQAQIGAANAMGIPLGDYAAWAAGVRQY